MTKAKVLILGNKNDELASIQQSLALEDIKADIVTDTTTGLQMLKDNSYDLVLLDSELSPISEQEILRGLRASDPFVLGIIYTSGTEFARIKQLVNLGIDGYVNKTPDFDLRELVDQIKNKLFPVE